MKVKNINSLPKHVQSRIALGNAGNSHAFMSATLQNGQMIMSKEKLWSVLQEYAVVKPSGNGITINLRF